MKKKLTLVGVAHKNMITAGWHDFLLRQAIMPWQSCVNLHGFECTGITRSRKKSDVGEKEDTVIKYFFSDTRKIYADRISKLALEINKFGNGCVIERLNKYFESISIYAVEEFNCYDFEFIKLLRQSTIKIIR